jgi:hydroxyethylthiazole kinase-like uncharacterized protein yjeF
MSVPVLSLAQMREWEQASWEAGRSQSDVISKVGQLIAERALQLTRVDDRILILAGKGHNGDDAKCSQSHLLGRKVKVLTVTNPQADLQHLQALLDKRPELIIDGLFGIGLNRALDGYWAEFIEAINTAGLRVLAVDVPSGLNADTGETEGVAIYAQITLTLGAPKRGLLKLSTYPFVGRLEVLPEIGLVKCPFESEIQWSMADDFRSFSAPRRVDGHKGSFGHGGILAGSVGYHGASVLASRGALRAMPGLVSLFCSEKIYVPAASQLQAAMVHPWRPGQNLPESCSALVIGPGFAGPDLTDEWKQATNDFWQTFPQPVIVDASALNWIQPGPTALNSRRVITPHPGEAARLLQTKPAVIQENRVAALRELSSRFGNCWVVLKGHQTLVGRSTGEVYVNSSGNPFLAQGGSGDVLSGYMAGLLAQPKHQPHPLRTIRYAIWQHGASADHLTAKHKTWTIEDLLQIIGDA